MENLENKILHTFLENLTYLEKHDKELHDRVVHFSNMIQNGEYKERYHLEYIQEDNKFDIYDECTGRFLYNKKPKEFIENAVKESNLDKKSTIDLLMPESYNQRREPYVDLTKNELSITTTMCMKDIFDYIKIFKKSTAYKHKEFKYFEKFMFIGTLLGTHIQAIINKLNLNFALIYEYDLEIFRLSLFTTNYAELSKNTHFLFSVMENKKDIEKTIKNYFNYAFRSNFMIKYYCSNYNINDFFERILAVSSTVTPFSFTYWKILHTLLEPSLQSMVKYPTLDTSKNTNILSTQQVLILAAGPSLSKNIEWVKENQDNFFIIAIGAAVNKLIKNGIHINLITNVDGDRLIKNQFPDDIRDKIKDITFITTPATNKQVLNMFEEESIVLLESMTGLKKTSYLVPGYSVGEIALNTAFILGAEDIYLLGSDLALDQETGSSHADGHQHNKVRELTDDAKEHNSFMKTGNYSMASSTLLVKGNFQDKVVTTAVFEKSISAYEVILKSKKLKNPKANVYNLNNGAYFEGAQPLKIEDINLKNINIINNKEFANSLKRHTYLGFTEEEKEEFKKSVESVDILIEHLKELQKVEVNTYEDFNTQRNNILTYFKRDFRQFSRFFLDRLFINYIFMTEPYLGYQLNDKELEDEANYIIQVKEVWCNHILNLTKKYKDIVEPIYAKL